MRENIANSESGPISGQQPAERADSPFKAEIAEILRSDEFTYALLATMSANTHHNDHNQFQNAEALNILRNFAKENADQDLIAKVATLAEFSKTNKSWDRNYSLATDIIRLTAGAISLGAAISTTGKDKDSQEVKNLHSAAHIAQIISLATQIISSPITANKGYKAAITGHFANEMGDALAKVLESLGERIAASKIVQNLTESCSHPSHGHFGHNHSHENTDEDHGQGHSHGKDHGHAHAHHAGSLQRHSGTALNIASMALGIARAANWLKEESGSSPALNDLQAAVMALTAPILTLAGKNLSLWAANIREKEVLEKTQGAKESFNEQLTAVFQKVQDLSFSSAEVSIADAKTAILQELVKIGREAELDTQRQREARGLFVLARDSGKYAVNYAKDSFYGLSYEAIKFWQIHIPEMWQQSSNLESTAIKNGAATTRSFSELLPTTSFSADIEAQTPQTWKTTEELRKLITEKYPALLSPEQNEDMVASTTDTRAQDKTGLAGLAENMQRARDGQNAGGRRRGERNRTMGTRRRQEAGGGLGVFPTAFFESLPTAAANSNQGLPAQTLDAELTFGNRGSTRPNQGVFGRDDRGNTGGNKEPIVISSRPSSAPAPTRSEADGKTLANTGHDVPRQ